MSCKKRCTHTHTYTETGTFKWMLNFKFDAAWLLLPSNIYHEIRKTKLWTKKNALINTKCVYLRKEKVVAYFLFKMQYFSASPWISIRFTFKTRSTTFAIIQCIRDDKRTLMLTSYELYDFIRRFFFLKEFICSSIVQILQHFIEVITMSDWSSRTISIINRLQAQ